MNSEFLFSESATERNSLHHNSGVLWAEECAVSMGVLNSLARLILTF
jgi:hypothetical protein